jgi:hypothetical protein
MQKAVGQLYHHIPGVGMSKRWGEDINKMIQQSQGGQSRSIRNASQQAFSQIPFTAFTHPEMQGDVTRFSTKQDNQILRALFGINIRQIDKQKAKEERLSAEEAAERRAEREKTQELSNIKGEYIYPGTKRRKRKRTKRRRKRR